MPYVPPHKRRLGAATATATSTSTSTATSTATATATATATTRSTPSDTGRRTRAAVVPNDARCSSSAATTKEHDTRASANASASLFFCGAFSSIRCINLEHRPDQWERFLRCGRRHIGPEFVAKVRRFDAVNGGEELLRNSCCCSEEETEGSPNTNKNKNTSDRIVAIGADVAREWDTSGNAEWDRHITPGTRELSPGEIGCALSHVSLWRELVASAAAEADDSCPTQTQSQMQMQTASSSSMLIFEDDARFYTNIQEKQQQQQQQQHSRSPPADTDRFLRAFRLAHGLLPDDWDVFYLGFSDRGERRDLVRSRDGPQQQQQQQQQKQQQQQQQQQQWSKKVDDTGLSVAVFRPTYGFHTHAYALTRTAAEVLLSHLPVVGPIDVWLADNDWFGLNVRCAVVANEGWKRTGAVLVHQDRGRSSGPSTVRQSGRR